MMGDGGGGNATAKTARIKNTRRAGNFSHEYTKLLS